MQRMVANGWKKEKKLKILLLVSWFFFFGDSYVSYRHMKDLPIDDEVNEMIVGMFWIGFRLYVVLLILWL